MVTRDGKGAGKVLVGGPDISWLSLRKPVADADLIALPSANAQAPKTRNQNEGPGDNGERAWTMIQLSAK